MILVADSTVFSAGNYYKDKSTDFFDLRLNKQIELISEFGEKFGKHFDLKWFQQLKFDIQALPNERVIQIGRKLCELYLKRYSNYPQNNRDWLADLEGCYKDKMLFQPTILEGGHVNPECFFEMTAEEVFSNG